MASHILPPRHATEKSVAHHQRESQDTPTKPPKLCRKCGVRPVSPARAKVRHHICGPCYEQLPSNRRYRHSSKWRDARRRYERSEGGKGVRQRYAQSEQGKAAQRRYNESTRGKLRTQRDTCTALVARPQSDLVESHEKRNLALETSFEQFLLARTCSDHTRRAYGRVVQDFLAFVHNGNVDELSHVAIREYLHWLQSRGLSPQSIARETFALKAFFAFLERLGIVELSPAKHIRNRRLPKKLPQFHNEDEMEQLIAGAYDARSKAILEVFYATGVRVTALCNIRLEDIDFNARTILIQRAKGGKQRIVLFGRPAEKAMKAYLNGREDGFLFPSERRPGHPLTRETVYQIVNRCSQRAGLGRMNCHKIRHSFATALFNRGADIMYVKELLGHESISTTQVYTHVAQAGLQRTMEKYHPRW